jgi:hypothetical protein
MGSTIAHMIVPRLKSVPHSAIVKVPMPCLSGVILCLHLGLVLPGRPVTFVIAIVVDCNYLVRLIY